MTTETIEAPVTDQARIVSEHMLDHGRAILSKLRAATAAVEAFVGVEAEVIASPAVIEDGKLVSVSTAPGAQLVLATGSNLTESLKDLKIASPEAYQSWADDMQKMKGLVKGADETLKTMTAPIRDAEALVRAIFAPLKETATTAERTIKNAMIAYDDEQAEIARQAAAKAEETARLQREKLEAKAEKLDAAGKTEQAEAMAEKAASVVAAPVSSGPIKAGGISRKVIITVEVTDMKAFVKGVNDGIIPITMVEPAQAALNKVGSALNDAFNYPGCTLKKVSDIASRSKR